LLFYNIYPPDKEKPSHRRRYGSRAEERRRLCINTLVAYATLILSEEIIL